MIPSKYVPAQLEFLFFPYDRDFCRVYVLAFGMVPYNLICLRFVDECWGVLSISFGTNPICSILFISFWVSCMVSSPYISLDMTIELKARNFHAILVCALSKQSLH